MPFLHGLLLAVGLILPLGAQNVFIFSQGALQTRFRMALPVVIAAAICDTLLILLAILGVSVLIISIPVLKTILIMAGVLFLAYIGWTTWRSAGDLQASEVRYSPRKQIMLAVSVSLLNPHAIMDTIGVIGTSSLHYGGFDKGMFTAACILVSWLWFFTLALAGRMLGRMDTSGRLMKVVNKLSAVLIWLSAVIMVAINL
ncbi:LysE/ArgO family amino acid transporter [Paenibacillus glycanilyticus]|uniref:LysE/ArgO family amino acid transporter n=1 Tax=Paenibacillus glycanilyticus TaxID=126569 RepID=UPI00203E9295|nr:LysE/ArgO family amino acid transporter [Paenibacillus glycanilyticus]MCM3628590.1 LysE/ArgO family amino acid transporter [Paenibacillus glycanilyticus]